MSTSFRPRRVIPSAVNTPTCINVIKTTNISNEQAEVILSEFISVSEAIATTIPGATGVQDDILSSRTGFSNSTGNGAVLGQLRRVQRDLRGLPPLAIEAETGNKKTKFDNDNDGIEQPKNKKIKFDSEDESATTSEPSQKQQEQEQEQEQEDHHSMAEVGAPEEAEEEEEEEEVEEKKLKKDKKEKKKLKKEKKDKKP